MQMRRVLLALIAAMSFGVSHAGTATAARGITMPTAPQVRVVLDVLTIYSEYSLDYGDPRCPNGTDEGRNDCLTTYFAIGYFDHNRWVPVNPQTGCGTQDDCVYGTHIPCPVEPTGNIAYTFWQSRFQQTITPSDGAAGPPSLDIRYSPIATIRTCEYRFTRMA